MSEAPAHGRMIEIDFASADNREIHRLFYGLVIPRPIAWVSSISAEGWPNLAPHSFYNAVSVQPPIVMFASTRSSRANADGRKDSARNIMATREFVINVVTDDLFDPMIATSAPVGPAVDEFDLAGLTKSPSIKVAPPKVAAAKAAFECKLHSLLEIGDATAIFGEVVMAHVAAEILEDGAVVANRLKPVARLGGIEYSRLGDVFARHRPK